MAGEETKVLKFGAIYRRNPEAELRGRHELLRNSRVEAWLRHGVPEADRLLLENVPRFSGKRGLVMADPEGVSALVLAADCDASEIVAASLDAWRARRVEDTIHVNFSDAPTKPRVALVSDLQELKSEPGFDFAAMPLPHQQTERQLCRELVEQVRRILTPSGELYLSSDHHSDEWIRKVLKESFETQPTRLFYERKRGSVWKVLNKKPTEEPPRDHRRMVRVAVAGLEYELISRPGTFAYGRLDMGSKSLLERLKVGDSETILDLGCGNGVLGISAALLSPASTLTLVDSATRAVATAQENLQALGLSDRGQAILRADLEDLPPSENEDGYSLVLANPPYFSNWRIAERFVERAAELVGKNGRLVLVAKAMEKHRAIVAEKFRRCLAKEVRGYGLVVAWNGRRVPLEAELIEAG